MQSLREAALALLDEAVDHLQAAQDDAAVHSARQACKRVRAALRLLRESFGPGVYRRENHAVRDAARPLTAARDAFVLRETLRTLSARHPALQRGLDRDYQEERRALRGHGARHVIEELTAIRGRLAAQPLLVPEAASSLAGVRKVYCAARKVRVRAVGQDDAALHEWRKQTKYLLNELELLKSVFGLKCKKLRRRADRLAETLGDDRDLSVLMDKVHACRVRDPRLVERLEARRRKLQKRAMRQGGKLYRRSARRIEAAVRSRLHAPE